MLSNPITRRFVTIPAVVALLIVVTALSPVLAVLGGVVDMTRLAVGVRSWVTLRVLAFLWIYLLGEVWAVVALFVTAPWPKRKKIDVTFRLQERWASWNLRALVTLFSLEIVVEGRDTLSPGPVVVVSRHASIVDTLLPATIITRQTGLKLRYVLKRELLVDPALDLAGNRLPNVFIDRATGDASERAAIRSLAGDLGPEDGILIYPEGTRFSESKLRRLQARSTNDAEGVVSGLRRVLPPRPGGTLAILEATDADVVVLAHHGLEGLATVREIWAGGLVGSRISVRLWRIPREEIPASRSGRVAWLHRLWGEIDDWVVSVGST
ncbi:MAG TPA: lysophospholipid acyltransferase family protein [Acidimicrobiia bacterium]